MTLLTHMPGLWDYMVFISVIVAGISLVITAIVIILLAILHKENWQKKRYFRIALKLFLILFFIMFFAAWIILSMG